MEDHDRIRRSLGRSEKNRGRSDRSEDQRKFFCGRSDQKKIRENFLEDRIGRRSETQKNRNNTQSIFFVVNHGVAQHLREMTTLGSQTVLAFGWVAKKLVGREKSRRSRKKSRVAGKVAAREKSRGSMKQSTVVSPAKRNRMR